MGVKVEGLDELRAQLLDAKDTVVDETHGVVSKGALNIKKATRDRWLGMRHAPALPWAVTYDTAVDGTLITAEIGPDKAKRQGALGNLLEYGSINNAPRPALNPALDAEESPFVQALEDLGYDLLEGRAVRSDGPIEDSG